MATNYDVNYDDERFTQVEADKQQALTEVENTYGGMIDQTDQYYQSQIDASKEWADKQSQIQQENTDFLIEQIEQQKDQAQKDYTKEQSGAYVDWQKQSNQYGANAEAMAMNGMANTGYSESSQVAMYNTYQNRVATARESLNQTILNYNNNIKEAQLQNNSALAEIYYQAHQTQLQLALEGFQYKNSLIETQLQMKQQTEDRYYNRYQDVLAQINQEIAMAEEVRQYNESMALQREQLAEEIRQFNQSYELQTKEFEESIRQFDEEIARLKKKDEQEYALEIQQLELQKSQLKEQQRQFNKEYELKEAELKAQQQQYAIVDNKVATNNGTYSLHGGEGSSGANQSQTQKKATSQYVLYTVGSGGAFGNSKTVMSKSDYYFSNGYQPQYIDNTKLAQAKDSSGKGITVGDLDDSVAKSLGVPTSQKVWTAKGKAYVWNGSTKEYMYIGSV